METTYKVVKLTNGHNIICETVEHVNETYIIQTPLRTEMVYDDDSNGQLESLHLTAWISPFTDQVVEKLAKNRCKRLLVFSPAFVADCLETTIEISQEYLNIFRQNGGEFLDLVPSLNDEDDWVESLADTISDNV